MNPECLFCKIAAGKIPAKKVYEDDKFLAFLNINPASKGHTLIIPKTHSTDFLELPAEDEKEMFGLVQKLGKKLKTALGAKMVFLAVMGVDVAHTHVHIIPFYGAELPMNLKGQKADNLNIVLEEINAKKE